MDRRSMMVGAAAAGLAGAARADDGPGPARAFESGGRRIAVEWFAAEGGTPAPAVLLLHGADGLAFADRYRVAAGLISGAGYHVALPHYLDRTGERRVSYATLRDQYPLWAGTVRDAVGWLAGQPGVAAGRLGLVGVSLGAALALTVAADDTRVKAVVDTSGPLPEGLSGRLPPTLILHGEEDRIVPVSQARAVARRLAEAGTPHEIQVYPGQGHALSGPAQFDAAARIAAFLGRHLGA